MVASESVQACRVTAFILIRSNKMQQYAGIYLLQVYSTCFGRQSRPTSGVQKTVTAASGTGRSTVTMTCTRGCGYIFCTLMMGAMDARNM